MLPACPSRDRPASSLPTPRSDERSLIPFRDFRRPRGKAARQNTLIAPRFANCVRQHNGLWIGRRVRWPCFLILAGGTAPATVKGDVGRRVHVAANGDAVHRRHPTTDSVSRSVDSTSTPAPDAALASALTHGDRTATPYWTRDNQALLRRILQQNPLSQTQPCTPIGDIIDIAGTGEKPWGDLDCDGEVSTRDNQAELRKVLQQNPLSQTEPCPDIGTEIELGGSEPSSFDKIDKSGEQRHTDEEATIYRVYAAFGDSRLPDQYRGAPSPYSDAAMAACGGVRRSFDRSTGHPRAVPDPPFRTGQLAGIADRRAGELGRSACTRGLRPPLLRAR